jgi:hypothetical protein
MLSRNEIVAEPGKVNEFTLLPLNIQKFPMIFIYNKQCHLKLFADPYWKDQNKINK